MSVPMAEIHEHDGMRCRACGQEERASEGYPCTSCGTFICLVCSFRGVTLCAACAARAVGGAGGAAGQQGSGAGETDGPGSGA